MHFNLLAFVASALAASVAAAVPRDGLAALKGETTAVTISAAANRKQGATYCGWYLRDNCMIFQSSQQA